MPKAKVILAHADGMNGDQVEKAMSRWAQNAFQRFRKKLKPWNFILVQEADSTLLVANLPQNCRVWLVALWGHGRRRDGAFLDANGRQAVHRLNLNLLEDRNVCAFYCYSRKLYNTAVEAKWGKPQRFVGFRNSIWLVIQPSGTSYMGFEESFETALSSILYGHSAEFAAQKFREESSRWITYWGCNILLAAWEHRWNDAVFSLLCTFAFLNNINEVCGHD
jgi:hypothetical protein